MPLIEKFFIDLWGKIVELFGNYLGTSMTSEAAGKVIGIALIFASPTLLKLCHNWLKDYVSIYRMLRDDREKLTGQWVEIIKKNEVLYFTIFSIKWSRMKNDYQLEGLALNEAADEHATFASYYISPELRNGKVLEVLYEGDYASTGDPTSGYGKYAFNDGFNDGLGHIVDFVLEFNEAPRESPKLSFSFERILPAKIKQLIGRRKIRSRDDRLELVQAYASRAKDGSLRPSISPPNNQDQLIPIRKAQNAKQEKA